MAIPFLNNIDLSDNQLLNAKLQVDTAAPSTETGQIYFNSTAGFLKPRVYDGSAWLDLLDTSSIISGTYVSSTVTANVDLTLDLSAVDGTAGASERYLTKTNKWATVASITGTTYALSTGADGKTTLTGSDSTTTSFKIQGTTSEVEVGVTTGVDGVFTIGLPDDVTIAGRLTVSGTGQSSFGGQVTIPALPIADTDAASKKYVDDNIAGGLIYQGGYNAATNTPDLDSATSIQVNKGWTYTVTVDGLFFTEQVRVGDVLISESDQAAGASALANWTTVQNNIDLASLTQVGIGNVNAEPAGNLGGIAVSYTSGTAKVGLGIAALGVDPLAETPANYFIPIYNSADDENKKVASSDLLTAINSVTSKTGTITAGNLSGTVTHDFGINTLVQTINASGDTVYCEVTRTATTSVATISVIEATDITILVQKIG